MPPTPGGLTIDRFGFTGPASAPDIDPPPHYYRGTEMVVFEFETSAAAAAELVPEGLAVPDGPARAVVWFADFPFSTLGAYREAILAISCLWEGRRVLYCPYLIVTGEIGMIAGREIWGAPKLLGEVGWSRTGSVISCHVERPSGVTRLATGVIRPREPCAPRAPGGPPLVFLKVIPSPEEGRPPEVCELVEVQIESTVHVGSDGRPELFSGPGTLRLGSPSFPGAWALPVERLVRATYGKYDSMLEHGRVLHRYGAVAKTAAADGTS